MTIRLPVIFKGIGVAALLLLTVLLLVVELPVAVHFPEPDGLRIDQASFSLNGAEAEQVRLPHAWPRKLLARNNEGEYTLTFTLGSEQEREQTQFLLIPLTRLAPEVWLNGRELFLTRASAWASPLFEMPHLARLPDDALNVGTNVLTVRLAGKGGFRIGYLAPVYLGTDAQILPNYQLRAFLTDQQNVAVLVFYALLTFSVAGLWLARRESIYGWFCLMCMGFMVSNLVSLNPFHVVPGGISAILQLSLTNFGGVAGFGFALTMIGRRRPRWLFPFAFIWAGTVLFGLLAYPQFRPLGGVFGLASQGLFSAAAFVLAREYRATRNMEHAVVSLAIMAMVFYGFVDIAAVTRVIDRNVLLFHYHQMFLITALAVILFRRLAISLNALDTANTTLRVRLAEQEAKLVKAHAHETTLATNVAREKERQRLTRDLHDGLSGHIVSIIALAENEEERDIEKAAREALDDLRLVIQSTDIGGEDIPVVLAYFRERVTLQLRRLDIALEWSTDHLPAITGVTPGHALSLLRILQEAVTNAIKHGPARRIAITGAAAQNGSARITVENDGHNVLMNTNGNGLSNMRQRAASLGGEVRLEPLPAGMRLTLDLPASLPASGA